MNRTLHKKVYLLCLIWAIPVIHFSISPSYDLSSFSTWLAFTISIFLLIKNIDMLPLSIPFVALLSPLAVNGKLFGLLPSELFLLGLFSISCVVFLSKRKTTIKLLSGELFLIALLIIVIISFFASTEFQTLSKS